MMIMILMMVRVMMVIVPHLKRLKFPNDSVTPVSNNATLTTNTTTNNTNDDDSNNVDNDSSNSSDDT